MTAREATVVPEPALRLWRHIAGDQGALVPGTVTIVRGSQGLCPDGWTGVLRLGDAYVIEAGDASNNALKTLLGIDDPVEPEQVNAALRPARTLGPGELAYLVEPSLPRDDAEPTARVKELLRESVSSQLTAIPRDDLDESGIGNMERLLVAERDGELLGAAGHVDWPTEIAHIGVIVAPDQRGTGLGVALGAAASRRALNHGRYPQVAGRNREQGVPGDRSSARLRRVRPPVQLPPRRELTYWQGRPMSVK